MALDCNGNYAYNVLAAQSDVYTMCLIVAHSHPLALLNILAPRKHTIRVEPVHSSPNVVDLGC